MLPAFAGITWMLQSIGVELPFGGTGIVADGACDQGLAFPGVYLTCTFMGVAPFLRKEFEREPRV